MVIVIIGVVAVIAIGGHCGESLIVSGCCGGYGHFGGGGIYGGGHDKGRGSGFGGSRS